MESIMLEILNSVGAIITKSHIVYTSGLHGEVYINKDALYPHTKQTSLICLELARLFKDYDVEVVVGPAKGGIVLSQWVSHHLSELSQKPVLSVYAEKDNNGEFVIKRGYDKLLEGKNVLVVEDILNTGGSAKNVVETVPGYGGNVVGLGVLCNRGGVTTEQVGNPPVLKALIDIELQTYDPEDCPLCQDNLPINTDVGHGKEFLEKKGK